MIPSPRIAVIDDEEDSVKAIRESLESMDTSCLPVLVRAGEPSVKAPIRGIRLLFLDVHLVSGNQQGASLYDTNASILQQVLASDNGPYVLVVWTSHKAERDGLLEHISKHYQNIPQPLASLVMAKEEYRNGAGFDMPKVAARIADLLREQPQANALLHWENAVDLACGDLIARLCSFVPREEMFLGDPSAKLERTLTAIAQSAVGVLNLERNELGAINDGLMPLLNDRLAHLPDQDGNLLDVWKKAISKPADKISLEMSEKIDLDSMYHVAPNRPGPITCGTRGAIYELPRDFDLEKVFLPGTNLEKIYVNYFQFQPKDEVTRQMEALQEAVAWCLVGLRAACDQAQPKGGTNRLILSARIKEPLSIKGLSYFKQNDAIFMTMPLVNGDHPFRLVLNFRFLITLSDEQLKALSIQPLLRLRDNMCSVIETQFATHACRPGLMKMD